jgi:hypothetical protein
MNGSCKAKTAAGKPCRAGAGRSGLCALHETPERAAELGRRSGRARRYVLPSATPQQVLPAPRTAQDVTSVIGQAISDLRARRLDPKVATALGYLANVLLKAIQQNDLEGRLTALEDVLAARAAGAQ